MKFLSPEVALYLCKSTYAIAWNTVVMPGLLFATWNCYVSYENRYAGLLVLYLLLFSLVSCSRGRSTCMSFGSPSYGGSYKITIVCLSLRPTVWRLPQKRLKSSL